MTDEVIARKESTRDEIIQAAYRLFLENGFHGTSMRSIAREAGIALGGIYNHFTSKEAIYTSIILEHHPYLEMLIQLKSAKGDTLESLLYNAAQRIDESLMKKPEDFLKLVFLEMVEFKGEHISQLFPQIFPQFIAFEKQFFAGREELREFPPLLLGRAFVGLIFSYFITEWVFGMQLPSEARGQGIEQFINIYLHGILKAEER